MDTARFVRRQNVERYLHLLQSVAVESERQRILKLLAQERQQQKTRAILLTNDQVSPRTIHANALGARRS